MSVTREQIVAEARSWKGTKFRHQGSLKGAGCDCKGFIAGVARELDLPESRSVAALACNYSKGFRGRELFDGLSNTLIRVREAEPGDVLAILWPGDHFPRHLAILTRPGWIIHAYAGGVRRIAEVPIADMRVHSIWTWPSLEADHG